MGLRRKGLAKAGVVLATALVVAFGGLAAVDFAWAAPAADPVYLEGTSWGHIVDTPDGPVVAFFLGDDLTFAIRGEEHLVTGMAVMTGPPRETDDGNLIGQSSHLITFEDGSSIQTLDHAVLEPTSQPGVFTFNSNMEIVAGTGDFEGITGRMTAHGMLYMIPIPGVARAEFVARGSIKYAD